MLDYAIFGNDLPLARLLIERGANVNVVDKNGMTPLLWAANIDFGDSAMVELLLNAGASPDARNRDGLTPLELAKKYNHTHVIPALERAARSR